MEIEQTLIKRGGTAYYWSSKFLPKDARADVFRLYSFIRLADEYAERGGAKKAQFKRLRRAWQKAATNPTFDPTPVPLDSIDERVIKNIVYLAQRYRFEPTWVASFWDALQADVEGKRYKTLDDTLWYVFGSAEVIGLMLAKILGLKRASYQAVQLQGRAMQFINFIRDLAEDAEQGHHYFPAEDLARFGLPNLKKETAIQNEAAFTKFVQFELARYQRWHAEAEQGMGAVPRRVRIPLKTASRMYEWTAKAIARDPLTVYIRKVRPSKSQVLLRGFIDLFTA